MKTNMLSNERGGMAALLSVVVLSMIMVTTLTSFYIYIENRAKFQERIRVNYQMGYVIEDMSRAIVQARQEAIIALAGGACPANKALKWVDCLQVCASDVTFLGTLGTLPADVTSTHAVCIRNDQLNKVVNNADYFCSYNLDGGDTIPAYCAGLAKNEDNKSEVSVATLEMDTNVNSGSRIQNWYARLDNFFDTTIVKNVPGISNQMQNTLQVQIKAPTILGWLLPETANAQTQPPGEPPTGGGNEEDESTLCGQDPIFCKAERSGVSLGRIGGATGCAPGSGDPRCQSCVGNDRRQGRCLKFSVCPPWINARECVAQVAGANAGNDKRIHQVVMLTTAASVTNPPLCWGNVSEPPTPASSGYNRTASCDVRGSCTTAGESVTSRCLVQHASNPSYMEDNFRVRCGAYTNAPFVAGALNSGCSDAPAFTPPACTTTFSNRACSGAEVLAVADEGCCGGVSRCRVGQPFANCNVSGPGGGMGAGGCPAECSAYAGGPGNCVSSPVQGGCRVFCSGSGTIFYRCM